MWRIMIGLAMLMFINTACSLSEVVPQNPEQTAKPAPVLTTLQPPILATASNGSTVVWTDELSVMRGICFESAFDAAGRTFVMRNADELNTFFDLSDNSQLCRQPVERQSFDFSDGRILAGIWSIGSGCTARHQVTGIEVDDEQKKFTMRLRFVTEGDCNYELVRPFWVGLNSVTDYEISLVVE
jgi:hypothetical protein